MRDPTSQLSDGLHLLRLQQLLSSSRCSVTSTRGTDVAVKPSFDGSWYTFVEYPTVRAVVMSKAEIHGERLSRVECAYGHIDVAFSILWVHTLEPAITEFLLELRPVNASHASLNQSHRLSGPELQIITGAEATLENRFSLS